MMYGIGQRVATHSDWWAFRGQGTTRQRIQGVIMKPAYGATPPKETHCQWFTDLSDV